MVSEILCHKKPYRCAGCGIELEQLSGYCQQCLDRRNEQFLENFHQRMNHRVEFYYWRLNYQIAFHCYKPRYWRLDYGVYRKSARVM